MSKNKQKIQQKIQLYKRQLPDLTWAVIRCVFLYQNGQFWKVSETQEFLYKTQSHATRKFNELKAQVPSCEFVIHKDNHGDFHFEIVEKGQVFNTIDTLLFDVPETNEKDTSATGATLATQGADVSPPHSNTGGLNLIGVGTTETTGANTEIPPYEVFGDVEAELAKLHISELYAVQVMEQGQLKTIMLRRGLNTPAFIDTISFTVQESAFSELKDDGEHISGFECVMKAIVQVSECMGFSPIHEISGRNGYASGLQFGIKEQERNFGFVCWGGNTQKETMMFHFTGEGLANARQDWEKRLFLLLKKCGHLAKITRVDISHDFLCGEYQIEQAVSDWQADKFTVRQTKPQAEMQGVDWLSGTKKGRTFYIGSKKSSRILYFYEKGKQLGDEESPWLRLELRQRNKDYIIPFDVLLYAGDYLCTAYPYLFEILNYEFSEQHRFERVKKANGIGIEHVVKYASMQVSPAIQMLKSLGLDNAEVVERLFNENAKLPKRLLLDNLQYPLEQEMLPEKHQD